MPAGLPETRRIPKLDPFFNPFFKNKTNDAKRTANSNPFKAAPSICIKDGNKKCSESTIIRKDQINKIPAK